MQHPLSRPPALAFLLTPHLIVPLAPCRCCCCCQQCRLPLQQALLHCQARLVPALAPAVAAALLPMASAQALTLAPCLALVLCLALALALVSAAL